MSFVDFFPPELTEVVFSYLSVPDLVNSSIVCVSWYEASNTSSVWRAAIKKSYPKHRFRILSNLDRFTGIASNYDKNHCFQVDRQSPCNLSTMNPWKLSLCQNNFVRSNWSGSHNTILARHQIEFEDDMMITHVRVEYPSKLPQDCLYLPILVMRVDQPLMDFLLVRLDGTPRISQKILSTEKTIHIVCVDRDCAVWVHDRHVKYLSLVCNKDSSQIENLGRLVSESGSEGEDFSPYYMLSMNDKYIVASFENSFVKIWCKKTKQMKRTLKTTHNISNVNYSMINCNLYNEIIYFKHCEADGGKRSCLEFYDIEEDKSFRNTYSSLRFDSIALNDKYYIMLSELEVSCEISVREIETNEVKINLNVDRNGLRLPSNVWIVDDKVLYIEKDELKFLSLVDWSISNGMFVPIINPHSDYYDIWDTFLLVKEVNEVKIWNWERGIQHELLLDISPAPERANLLRAKTFHNDETRLVVVDLKCINVIGFW